MNNIFVIGFKLILLCWDNYILYLSFQKSRNIKEKYLFILRFQMSKPNLNIYSFYNYSIGGKILYDTNTQNICGS